VVPCAKDEFLAAEKFALLYKTTSSIERQDVKLFAIQKS